jgi:hypothetical protein
MKTKEFERLSPIAPSLLAPKRTLPPCIKVAGPDFEVQTYNPLITEVGAEGGHVENRMRKWRTGEIDDPLPTGWFFWDETSAWCYGPYSAREYAEEALNDYCDACL